MSALEKNRTQLVVKQTAKSINYDKKIPDFSANNNNLIICNWEWHWNLVFVPGRFVFGMRNCSFSMKMFCHQLEANANNKLFYQFRDQKPLSTQITCRILKKLSQNHFSVMLKSWKPLIAMKRWTCVHFQIIFKWETQTERKTPRTHGVKWISHIQIFS